MMGQGATIPLVIFAKAPVPGMVKTRLQPQLTKCQSAELAKLLLQITINKAIECWPGEVILSVGVDANHPFLVEMSKEHHLRLESQAEGDLGQRMHSAMQQFGYPAAIIGSDIPQISKQALQDAYTHLCGGNNVLGPSDDGGYYLLGLTESKPALFEKVVWGSDKVLAQTLEKAQGLSLDLQQLALINDVDTWSDLSAAAKEVPQLQCFLDSLNSPKP